MDKNILVIISKDKNESVKSYEKIQKIISRRIKRLRSDTKRMYQIRKIKRSIRPCN